MSAAIAGARFAASRTTLLAPVYESYMAVLHGAFADCTSGIAPGYLDRLSGRQRAAALGVVKECAGGVTAGPVRVPSMPRHHDHLSESASPRWRWRLKQQ